MRIGVVFPQTEIGADPGAIRAYAQHAEDLGYTHLLAYDHVLGADPEVHARLERPVRRAHHVPRAVRAVRLPGGDHVARAGHRHHHPAAAADRAGRQAGGRGGPAHRRAGSGSASASAGTRSSTRRWARTSEPRRPDEEQMELLRRLWTETVGDLRGRFEQVDRGRAGAAASPAADPAVDRRPVPERLRARRAPRRRLVPAGPARARARRGARQRGRGGQGGRPGPGELGHGGPGQLAAGQRGAAGRPGPRLAGRRFDPLSVNTMGAGSTSVDGHLEALSEVAAALQLTSEKP